MALGVRELVRRGAVVKRLSAVETLGSAVVICTDKTGTLTENRMHVATVWTTAGPQNLPDADSAADSAGNAALAALAAVMTRCDNAQPATATTDGIAIGEPTELALLEAAGRLGQAITPVDRERGRRRQFHFDPVLKLMSTVDERDHGMWTDTKGADDNFATIVTAVGAGRRIYDNIRKFICYIFAHTTPEITPFLVFALGGGAIPLPLAVLQLLAFDVGTETLPALALGRERAEPGLMDRPPRPRSEGVIRGSMLLRARLFLGVICAALQMAGFFAVLIHAGWNPGAPTGPGTPLHHASLRSIGVFTNPLLLGGIGFELALAALFIYAPPFQHLLGTAALTPSMVALVIPFPFVVWGADELRRWLLRRRAHAPTAAHHNS
uniref:Putative sodium/potassium-transporting protein n=1 Tax=Streptomyces lavendulae TaxID=1914 RepID=I2FGE3_STRLA|nr:putative sodium/potassium-transporting protein [Streptomyces lavendulae]